MKYDANNLHPFSTCKTQLIWEGKYDEHGNRRSVDISSATLPLQRIEQVDQPRSEAVAEGQLPIFEKEHKRNDDFVNRLIWGDNKVVMASLLEEFEGEINLIYLDPPFNVGADFTMDVPIGDGKDKLKKDATALETVAYCDIWGKGTDSYLHFMYERLTIMRNLLAEDGSIYLHCDPTMSHYLKLLMDDVFNANNFRNEIVWSYHRWTGATDHFQRMHDTIFFYTKDKNSVKFNTLTEPYSEKSKHKGKRHTKVHADGTMEQNYTGDTIREKAMRDVWEISYLNSQSRERIGYPTQKPMELLERVIKASSNEGGIVFDPFCGCGTTGAAAEKLGRKWIMADIGRFAIHTTRKRMIDLQRSLYKQESPYRAFGVYNAGKYERQWWQKSYLNDADTEHRRVVLELFDAQILPQNNQPSPFLHGVKEGTYCYVAPIDTIFGTEKATLISESLQNLSPQHRTIYCLAWEFEMELHQNLEALRAMHGTHLRPIRIPREVMEKNNKAALFLSPAYIDAKPIYHNDGTVNIELTDFIPYFSEIPEKHLEKVKGIAENNPFDFIDFWAIDFDWKQEQPFNHHWQDYRTKQDRSLVTISTAHHKYDTHGEYLACIHVVDIFGCDTQITVPIEVKQ